MDARHRLETRPVADQAAVVQGETFRITVLTEGLLRLEYADDGRFEDRASAFALIRDLPVPHYRVVDGPHHLAILTDRVHLVYDRGPFTTSGLSIQVRGNPLVESRGTPSDHQQLPQHLAFRRGGG
jgi:hypothetical protein